MKDSHPDIPAFETLAADPEIAPLLDFVPVVRKVKRPDGWTPELQRELIARLAATGTLQSAVWQMGKHATGAEGLYNTPAADGFRAAWDAALIIGRRRNGLDSQPPFTRDVPGITRRRPAQRGGAPAEPAEDEPSEEQKLELLERLAGKFLRKVAQERGARLSGEIVAADFYLRQITVVEIAFELASDRLGFDAGAVLRDLRRGSHGLPEIADTPFVRFLDEQRRDYWRGDPGEPPRPVSFREEYLHDHGDHRTEPANPGIGACTPPARGYTQEQWAAMGHDAQKEARQAQNAQDAAEQMEWERRAQEAWGASEHGAEARRAVAEHIARSRSDP